eukprot:6206187-Pleurochrysis_carterae.AAC.2
MALEQCAHSRPHSSGPVAQVVCAAALWTFVLCAPSRQSSSNYSSTVFCMHACVAISLYRAPGGHRISHTHPNVP